MTWPAHTPEIVAWLIAAAWVWKVVTATLGLPRVPDLLLPEYDQTPQADPRLTVIVPARNEAANISACLLSLIGQDYPNLNIIAVDDRSEDTTADRIRELIQPGGRLQLLQIEELPPGWLGKTNAMHQAAREALVEGNPDFLLFTDADVVFRPDGLRRSLAYAETSGADHLITAPTALVKRWDEGMLLGVFQIIGIWAVRSWKVADPKSMRDAVGVGAFNLLRTSAYVAIGGFEPLRMQVVEDIGLGRRVKRLRLKQRIVFGRGLVEVHWAKGARGLIGVMTKNVFAATNYNVLQILGACLFLRYLCIGPVLQLFYRPTMIPGFISLIAIARLYSLIGRRSGVGIRYAPFFPIGSAVFIYVLLLSTITTLVQGGVRWRGTFYSLKELRKNSSPL